MFGDNANMGDEALEAQQNRSSGDGFSRIDFGQGLFAACGKTVKSKEFNPSTLGIGNVHGGPNHEVHESVDGSELRLMHVETVFALREGQEIQVLALLGVGIREVVCDGDEGLDGTANAKVRLAKSLSTNLIHHVENEGMDPFDQACILEVAGCQPVRDLASGFTDSGDAPTGGLVGTVVGKPVGSSGDLVDNVL